jgi:hypothetical protein
MWFTVHGQPRSFTPITIYRAEHQLPDTFGVALFQPKDYSALGSMEHSGKALQMLQTMMLDAIPNGTPSSGWTAFVVQLQMHFRTQLIQANTAIGLRPSEISYAVIGFNDVCQQVIHALLSARMRNMPPPTFDTVYTRWLNSTLAVSQNYFDTTHGGESWRVHLVRHIYGRMGLVVHRPQDTDYVYDPAISCPAEAYMGSLLRRVAERLTAAITQEAG